MLPRICILPLFLFVFSCKSEQKFSGGVAEACSGFSDTVVSSETTAIQNRSPNQIMVYRIGLQDCDNATLENATIRTDLKAYLSEQTPRAYRLSTASGQLLAEGYFNVVRGQDLFGNQGDQFTFWESEPTSIVIEEGYVVLELDYSNLAMWPFDGTGGVPPVPSDTVVDSFFSLSNAGVVQVPLAVKAP